QMALSILKTTAIAAALVVATASSSFAATWAVVLQDSFIRANHSNGSAIVDSVEEGDAVRIIGSWGQCDRTNPQGPGPHGWIRKYKVDLDYEDDPSDPGVQFCFNGPLGYFCVNQ